MMIASATTISLDQISGAQSSGADANAPSGDPLEQIFAALVAEAANGVAAANDGTGDIVAKEIVPQPVKTADASVAKKDKDSEAPQAADAGDATDETSADAALAASLSAALQIQMVPTPQTNMPPRIDAQDDMKIAADGTSAPQGQAPNIDPAAPALKDAIAEGIANADAKKTAEDAQTENTSAQKAFDNTVGAPKPDAEPVKAQPVNPETKPAPNGASAATSNIPAEKIASATMAAPQPSVQQAQNSNTQTETSSAPVTAAVQPKNENSANHSNTSGEQSQQPSASLQSAEVPAAPNIGTANFDAAANASGLGAQIAPAAAPAHTPAVQMAVLTEAQAQTTVAADPKSLGMHIAAKATEDVHQFDIRLDPPELGRIEVKLDVSQDGKAQASLVADRPQTLHMLQNDSGALVKALRDSGLDLAQSGLSFSLKGDGQNAERGRQNASSRGRDLKIGAVDAAETQTSIGQIRWNNNPYGADSRLDISV